MKFNSLIAAVVLLFTAFALGMPTPIIEMQRSENEPLKPVAEEVVESYAKL